MVYVPNIAQKYPNTVVQTTCAGAVRREAIFEYPAEFALTYIERVFHEKEEDFEVYLERRRLRRLVPAPNRNDQERALNPPRICYFTDAGRHQQLHANPEPNGDVTEAVGEASSANATSGTRASSPERPTETAAATAEPDQMERPARLLTPFDLGAGAT